MKSDYLDSEEFKEILQKYEASKQHGTHCYFDAEDYVDISDYYLMDELPEDALAAANTGLELHPDDVDLLSTKSGIYIFMDKFEDAREIINTLPPKDGNVLYQRAQLAYAIDNDVTTAEELFTDWIEAEEKAAKFEDAEDAVERMRDAHLHIITSFIELRGKNYDEELVKRWIEAYYARFAPLGDSEFDLILADTVRTEGMTDMVEMIYSSLLEKDPYINHGYVVLATSQVMNGHFQEAIESADFALAIYPDNPDAILCKAHSYYSLSRKDLALPYFESFLEKIDDVNQYIPYALCLISEDRVEDAKPYLEKANEHIINYKDQKDYYAQSNFELAEAYSHYDSDKAKECIEKATELYPDDLDYLMLQGTIYLSYDMVDDYLKVFSHCIDLAEDKVLIICEVALRFIIRGYHDPAIKIIDSADSFKDNSKSYKIVNAYKAFAYFFIEKYKEFLDYLEIACKECPERVEALFRGRFPDTVAPKDYYNFIINNPLFTEDSGKQS